MEFQVSSPFLEKINPFYFICGHDLRLLSFGPSLKKLLPFVTQGSAIDTMCSVVRPPLALQYDELRKADGLLLVLKVNTDEQLYMKGQILALPHGALLFLGSPAVTHLDRLQRLGLAIQDFAVHDPLVDYLFLQQAATQSLTEATQMAQEMALRAEEEKLGLGRFPSESPHPVLRLARDGTLLYANESSRPLLKLWGCGVQERLAPEWRRILLEPLTQGAIRDLELACGELYFSLDIVPIDKADYFNVYARNITDKKQSDAQIEIARVKAIASAKMAALGEMAGGVAHEVNNPLAIIEGKACQLKRLLANRALTDEMLDESLNLICRTTARISKIVRGLRLFSRSAEHDPFIEASLEQIVTETLALCRQRFAHHAIRLEVSGLTAAQVLECRASEISQVLLNLLLNSFDAIVQQPGAWVRIDVSEELDSYILAVTDSGPGITAEAQKRLFQPFFTTKEVGKGTGLGLSISRSIAEGHSGSIHYDSSSPHTRFLIRLPRRQHRPAGYSGVSL